MLMKKRQSKKELVFSKESSKSKRYHVLLRAEWGVYRIVTTSDEINPARTACSKKRLKGLECVILDTWNRTFMR